MSETLRSEESGPHFCILPPGERWFRKETKMNADLETCITASCDIPPLPLVATKVVELLGNENVTAAQLTEGISRDLALATRGMNMANSAFYRRLEEIRDLRSAIVILGMRTIRSIVYGASLKQMFSSSSFFDK